jgi:2-polyprenyl-3-methyl-5-hydroxy-6-metoxy-1,4-benzoquinol methylase
MEVDETIRTLFPTDEKLAAAVKGYERFALEIMRLQIDFDRTGVYAPQTYEEANANVYQAETMATTYLPGLLLAWYLWPHHYRQLQFFKTFVHDMARSGAEKFVEIATGTGIYSRYALQGAQSAVGVGYDISPASCAFTERHVRKFGLGERYETRLQNVLEDEPEPADWLISVELLEHLENPMVLLHAMRKILRPGGKAFVATALNAPNSDHIWLYRNVGEVMSQLHEAGFHVIQSQVNAAYPSPRPPEVAAFILT